MRYGAFEKDTEQSLSPVDGDDAATVGAAVDDRPGDRRRSGVRFCRLCVRAASSSHPQRLGKLDTGRYGGVPLPDLSGGGRHPGLAVREVYRQGQHLRGGHPCVVCHRQARLPHPGAQLLLFGGGRCRDHRLRRFGGARGPDRADRFGHRVQYRTAFPTQLPRHHTAARMRSGRGHRGHLQGAYHGAHLRAGGADARHQHAGHRAAAHLLGGVDHPRALSQRVRSHAGRECRRDVQSPAPPHVCGAGRALRTRVVLLPDRQRQGADVVRQDRQAVHPVGRRRRDDRIAHLSLSAALWRRVRVVHRPDARTRGVAVRQLALLPLPRHSLGGGALSAGYAFSESGRHGRDQCRGRSGRFVRALALHRSLCRRNAGLYMQHLFRHGDVGGQFFARGHGGGS